ncbi:MAG: hypothetical protein WBD67_10175 [Terracidiphilus sp.]
MRIGGTARAVMLCLLTALVATNDGCRKAPRAAEYEVLSVYIDSQLASGKSTEPAEAKDKGPTKIVILDTTEFDDKGMEVPSDQNGRPIPWGQFASSLQQDLPALEQATIDAFRKANRKQTTFERSFEITVPYELVKSSEVHSIFKNGGWPAYYKRFPDSQGLLTFSRVGFNADGKQALFYASNNCGGLCGVGKYVVMQKLDGRWRVEKLIRIWIS